MTESEKLQSGAVVIPAGGYGLSKSVEADPSSSYPVLRRRMTGSSPERSFVLSAAFEDKGGKRTLQC